MSNGTRKHLDDDVVAWIVISMIFGIVTLTLWATLLWQSVNSQAPASSMAAEVGEPIRRLIA